MLTPHSVVCPAGVKAQSEPAALFDTGWPMWLSDDESMCVEQYLKQQLVISAGGRV